MKKVIREPEFVGYAVNFRCLPYYIPELKDNLKEKFNLNLWMVHGLSRPLDHLAQEVSIDNPYVSQEVVFPLQQFLEDNFSDYLYGEVIFAKRYENAGLVFIIEELE